MCNIPDRQTAISLCTIQTAYDTLHVYKLSLKGQCHEIFDFWLFSWISFPQVLEYTIRAVSNFSKIRGDIRSSRWTTGVVANGKNLQS